MMQTLSVQITDAGPFCTDYLFVRFPPRIVVGRRELCGCFCRQPCTSPETLQAAVHFACFLAGAPFRARKSGKCTSEGPTDTRFAMHFPRNAAGSRALRRIPCTSSQQCKDLGEVHVVVQEKRGSARPRIQSARRRARIWGKCTSPRPKRTGLRKNSRKRIPPQVVCNSTRLSEYKRLPEGIMSGNDNNGEGWL